MASHHDPDPMIEHIDIPPATHLARDSVALEVAFRIDGLTPRGVRRRFVAMLRISIARASVTRQIDPAICEELWRALPATRGPRV